MARKLQIERVLIKHLPKTQEPAWRAQNFELIVTGSSSLLFGYVRDRIGMEDLVRNLMSVQITLENLPTETRLQYFRSFNFEYPGEEHPDFPDSEALLMKTLDAALGYAQGIIGFSKKRELVPAGKKRNWEAAAIARECRRIWKLETGDDAPRSQHHDRPASFGRFLEDMLEAFEIRSIDGGRFSAATALRSLASLEE